MTDQLVAFLRERLNEDEQVARAAGSGEIEAVEYLWETKYLNVRRPDGTVTQTAEFSAELAGHIARHDPARVLAEVAVKRRIVDDRWGGPDHHDMWEHHLRLLALPYAGHEGFREEWRP